MNIERYRDKLMGCWLGKNIGGSLGTPFESKRGVFAVEFYTHDTSKGALPNDDLDLQLIWLNAAEKYGRNLDSEKLGEYWLAYIVADPSEYGAGKNNLAMGLLPPLSGWYNNYYRNSCGAFIRSEICACLAPGHPEIAVEYAFEDAIIDHSDEGVYAEIFCAALQSAAFEESDIGKLTDIALSYIPRTCAITLAVRTAMDCHKNGLTWKEARKKILQTVPGSFGRVPAGEVAEDDIPVGPVGYNAPSNIGLTMIGWLYGEGDFSKSVCTAVNCGEDTDCTAATLGALLGIIGGAGSLPQKWLDPIGDEINTICIDLTKGETTKIPKTITELTDRVCTLMPTFMGRFCELTPDKGVELKLSRGADLLDHGFYRGRIDGVFRNYEFKDKLKVLPLGVRRKSVACDVILDYVDGIEIREDAVKEMHLLFENNLANQQWATVTWKVPEGWTVLPSRETAINLTQWHGYSSFSEAWYRIIPREIDRGKYDLVLEVKLNGRLETMYIPVTFIVSSKERLPEVPDGNS